MPRKKAANGPSEILDPNFSDKQHEVAHALAYSGYRHGTRTPRGSMLFASSKAGISRQLVYRWLKNSAFVDLIARFRAEGNYIAYEGLFKAAAAGDNAACNSILARNERHLDP